MAIAYVNGTSGTSSLTFASPVANYIQFVFAFRDGSNTAPTVPTPPTGNAWTVAPSPASGANTCSSVLVYRVVASSSDTGSGTFTNATTVVGLQYSGCSTSTPVGNDSDTGASSATVSYNAVTFVDSSGNAWAVGFAGHRAVDNDLGAPTGMTNRVDDVDATDEASGHDTNGGVTGWSTTTKAGGGTSTGYRARVIELRPATTAYTITAASGTYSVTGNAAALKWGHKLTAESGTYAITGSDAALKWGHKVVAVSGTYAISGSTSGLQWAHILVAESGTYTITGNNAALSKGTIITADSGSYLLTGYDAALTTTSTGTTETRPGGFLPIYELRKNVPKQRKKLRGKKAKEQARPVVRLTADKLEKLSRELAGRVPESRITPEEFRALLEESLKQKLVSNLQASYDLIANNAGLMSDLRARVESIKTELLRLVAEEQEIQRLFIQLIVDDLI